MSPTTRRRGRTRVPAALLALALVAAACAGGADDPDPGDGRLHIVVTTTVLGDLVRSIVGEGAHVEVLMPVGADPHDFHASSRQVALINQADLVVANGLLLEEGLLAVLASAADDGANVLEVAPLVDPLVFEEDDHHHVEDDHNHEGPDPHVWMDPLRMVEAARAIAAELARLDTTVDWQERAALYMDELMEAHRQIEEILGEVAAPNRKLVTNHDSFRYLAARYGFEVVGVVIPGGATLAEPGSRDLALLVQVIEDEDVAAIFTEVGMPDALAHAVVGELGRDVAVVELYSDSLGEPGSGADTLIGMLITNAERIAAALG